MADKGRLDWWRWGTSGHRVMFHIPIESQLRWTTAKHRMDTVRMQYEDTYTTHTSSQAGTMRGR